MNTACVDIITFLESRIAEDEQLAREALKAAPAHDSRLSMTEDQRVSATGWRTLAEAALKRDMLFVHHDVPREETRSFWIACSTCEEPYPCQQLRVTVAVYSDHPSYDSAWTPHDPGTRGD